MELNQDTARELTEFCRRARAPRLFYAPDSGGEADRLCRLLAMASRKSIPMTEHQWLPPGTVAVMDEARFYPILGRPPVSPLAGLLDRSLELDESDPLRIIRPSGSGQ